MLASFSFERSLFSRLHTRYFRVCTQANSRADGSLFRREFLIRVHEFPLFGIAVRKFFKHALALVIAHVKPTLHLVGVAHAAATHQNVIEFSRMANAFAG
jgi:hypothetical protein